MAYYTIDIPEKYKKCYMWKKRTLNSYYCLEQSRVELILEMFRSYIYVYSCGWKGSYNCGRCGNCIREYYATIERMRGND